MKAQEQIEKLRTIQESMHEIADKVVSLGDGSVMLNDVAEGKKQIADAINIKGGNSTPDESFQQLASDIQTLPYAGISAEGIVQTEEFSFLDFMCSNYNNPITEIKDNTVTLINKNYSFSESRSLIKVEMNALTVISGMNVFFNCTVLQNIELPNLVEVKSSSVFSTCTALQNVELPNLVKLEGGQIFYRCANLVEIRLPKLEIFRGNIGIIGDNSRLQYIEFGVLTIMNEPFYNLKPNLRNITIGQDTNINLPFQLWTATNVIAEGQSGIDELNSNLYNNLLTKLYDHSNDGQTRTLRLGWLAHVTQENIDYANSKGWTLTT